MRVSEGCRAGSETIIARRDWGAGGEKISLRRDWSVGSAKIIARTPKEGEESWELDNKAKVVRRY